MQLLSVLGLRMLNMNLSNSQSCLQDGHPKVVMLLFGSGKIVITGGKKPEDAEAAVEKVVIELDGLGLL